MPGMNGLMFELWKDLVSIQDSATKKGNNDEKKIFNVVGALKAVYNDIEVFRVDVKTDFIKGWMCPIYKKKDKCEIGNYRLITVLNTDYKIFMKAIVTKLSKVVHKIIHKSQVGFTPERSILDQVRLTK